MYVERKVFSKGKIFLQGHQVLSVSSAAGLALIFLLTYYFQDDIKFTIVWQKKITWTNHDYVYIFVISLSNFNIFPFEQLLAVSILQNIGRNARVA